jgi:translation initiation factor 2B subunit (eIF-2B alpha/beta/delta family)
MVTETKIVSWKGLMTHFHKGTIVSTVTHGEDVLERMKHAGIQVKPLED